MIDENTHLKNIVKNKEQFQALKEYMLFPLEPQNWLPDVNFHADDSTYAQAVKSTVKARQIVLARLEDMERMLDEKKDKPNINQSR